jgi:hypothetical protein
MPTSQRRLSSLLSVAGELRRSCERVLPIDVTRGDHLCGNCDARQGRSSVCLCRRLQVSVLLKVASGWAHAMTAVRAARGTNLSGFERDR